MTILKITDISVVIAEPCCNIRLGSRMWADWRLEVHFCPLVTETTQIGV